MQNFAFVLVGHDGGLVVACLECGFINTQMASTYLSPAGQATFHGLLHDSVDGIPANLSLAVVVTAFVIPRWSYLSPRAPFPVPPGLSPAP